MKKFCLLLVCLLFAVPGVWANLLTNASFNTGPDDLNDWTGTSWSPGGNVGREWWASREGQYGTYFRTWDAAPAQQDGYFYQDVPQTVVSGETNTYTFSIWVRRELNSNPTQLQVKIEWLDGSFAEVEPQTIADWGGLVPNDAVWHPIYVTGSCTNPALAIVRCTVFAQWADPGVAPGDSALTLDTAELKIGEFGGTLPLWNQSFEERNDYDDWRDTQWSREGWGFNFEDWGWRTRWAGIGFWGWAADSNDYTGVVKQNAAVPGAGTYTLAAWIAQEANFLMTNAQLIIESYGTNMTQKVNDDIVTNITADLINDGAWREYFVTGTITGPVYEVTVKYMVQWDENSAGADPRAMKLDDVRLLAGGYAAEDPSADLSGIYHNNTNFNAAVEAVPGLGGATFFQYNYGGTNPESYVHILVPQDSIKSMTARLYFANGGGEVWRDGTWYTDVVISAASPFHGIPAVGSVTMEVWRSAFVPPGRWNDNMWYSPAVTLNDQRNLRWFLASEVDDPAITTGEIYTNDLPTDPQHFWTQTPYDHDYYYFVTGQVARTGIKTDWAYFNNTNYDPEVEVVPEWNGSSFLEVSYLTTTTTFNVMLDKPLKDNLLQDESIQVLMRTSWYDDEDAAWINDYTQMSWKTNLVLDSASPFHGLPISGTHTVDLWQLNWTQPLFNDGTPQTNVTVYYAPLLKIAFGPDQHGSEEIYLIRTNETAAGYGVNNYPDYPQSYGLSPFDNRDWFYINDTSLGGDDTDGDGVSDTWELRWFANLQVSGIGSNSDTDAQSDFEEYVSDSDPTDPNNYYTNVVMGLTGAGQYDLQVGPPTTNSRMYGVWYTTNLTGQQDWVPYSAPLQGDVAGGVLTLTVTNGAGLRLYRTGVMVP